MMYFRHHGEIKEMSKCPSEGECLFQWQRMQVFNHASGEVLCRFIVTCSGELEGTQGRCAALVIL